MSEHRSGGRPLERLGKPAEGTCTTRPSLPPRGTRGTLATYHLARAENLFAVVAIPSAFGPGVNFFIAKVAWVARTKDRSHLPTPTTVQPLRPIRRLVGRTANRRPGWTSRTVRNPAACRPKSATGGLTSGRGRLGMPAPIRRDAIPPHAAAASPAIPRRGPTMRPLPTAGLLLAHHPRRPVGDGRGTGGCRPGTHERPRGRVPARPPRPAGHVPHQGPGRAEGRGRVRQRYPAARTADGHWTAITDPQVPGFHYYWFWIDGAQVNDPGSETFFGWGRQTSGVEVPEKGVDFYCRRTCRTVRCASGGTGRRRRRHGGGPSSTRRPTTTPIATPATRSSTSSTAAARTSAAGRTRAASASSRTT